METSWLFNELSNKLSKNNTFIEIKSEEEFYFACGQLIRYLAFLRQDNIYVKNIYDYYMRAHSSIQLKQIIQRLLIESSGLPKNNTKLKNLIDAIENYRFVTYVSLNALRAGFVSLNVLCDSIQAIEYSTVGIGLNI